MLAELACELAGQGRSTLRRHDAALSPSVGNDATG
jgi:hypothetical protein